MLHFRLIYTESCFQLTYVGGVFQAWFEVFRVGAAKVELGGVLVIRDGGGASQGEACQRLCDVRLGNKHSAVQGVGGERRQLRKGYGESLLTFRELKGDHHIRSESVRSCLKNFSKNDVKTVMRYIDDELHAVIHFVEHNYH